MPMPRTTTVRVVCELDAPLRLAGRRLRRGRWRGREPIASVAPRRSTRVRLEGAGLLGDIDVAMTYEAGSTIVGVRAVNPAMGPSRYEVSCSDPSISVVASSSGDDDATVVVRVGQARRRVVEGFTPGVNGFRFPNRFPKGSLVELDVVLGSIRLGEASNGLCGGMVFAAADLFAAGRRPPQDTTPPPKDSVWFDFLARRLLDSLVPPGVLRYVTLMQPGHPVGDRSALAAVGTVESLASVTARSQWPRIMATIDRGELCPLGLVRVRSSRLGDLRHHHQVLAWGYEVRGTVVTLLLYDPNAPGRDTCTITFDAACTDRALAISHSLPSKRPVVALFATDYAPVLPPS
jgi:hypothetical protein